MVEPHFQKNRVKIYHGDAWQLASALEPNSVHTIVTSPPYWGLRSYLGDDQDAKTSEFGTEATPMEYIDKLVELFRLLRPALRDDGTVWLNLGDSYVHSQPGRNRNGTGGQIVRGEVYRKKNNKGDSSKFDGLKDMGLKPKDLVGMPWRVVFALQQDGWYLRSDIVWSKNNPMPEPVDDRPSKSHEYVFLLSKSPNYFYDADAIREPFESIDLETKSYKRNTKKGIDENTVAIIDGASEPVDEVAVEYDEETNGRNKRTVWNVNTKPFKAAHFATFPDELIIPCIKAGTSEKGVCPICGAPWLRVKEKTGEVECRYSKELHEDSPYRKRNTMKLYKQAGWKPSCEHTEETPVPATVLDPFMGSGTTAQVAEELGRASIGFELNEEYIRITKEYRLGQETLW